VNILSDTCASFMRIPTIYFEINSPTKPPHNINISLVQTKASILASHYQSSSYQSLHLQKASLHEYPRRYSLEQGPRAVTTTFTRANGAFSEREFSYVMDPACRDSDRRGASGGILFHFICSSQEVFWGPHLEEALPARASGRAFSWVPGIFLWGRPRTLDAGGVAYSHVATTVRPSNCLFDV